MDDRGLPKGLELAVLYGGRSGEREVSLASAEMVMSALREGGYEFRAIDTGNERWWTSLEGVDLAFNIQHGRGGEDGITQGLLKSLGVVGTGSDVLGSALAMDKFRSKQLWVAAGLPTADFVVVSSATNPEELLQRWGAAFIKPAKEGSSLGMARVSTTAEFTAAAEAAGHFDSCVIAERLIEGPEYTVAVLGTRVLPAIRIEAAREFYDYQAKYTAANTRYHIPSGLSAVDEAELGRLALRAFEAVGCSIWGRVDVMRDTDGGFQLLEVNTIPGMTEHSLVPMAAQAAGLSRVELIREIMLRSWVEQRGLGEVTPR